jgi:hypothetical protein
VWSRENRPYNWYPIYVSKDLQIISSNPVSDAYELYPRTASGDFSWKNVKETFDNLNRDGYFRAIKEGDKIIIQHKFREFQVLKNVWIDKKYQSEFHGTNLLKDLLGDNVFSYPKSLYVVVDILKIMTNHGDIVLDFFSGSGTTAHAVLELNKEDRGNRQFILCEQMDYIESITVKRVHKVIENNSEGDFVYCELMNDAEVFRDEVRCANSGELLNLLKKVENSSFLDCRVDRAKFAGFEGLTEDEQIQLLLELVDANSLYVNYTDI